jgi:hypothetical protein
LIRFEIPDMAAAARLLRLLARRWTVVLFSEESGVSVANVELLTEPGDLSLLLRQVEAWVEEESLYAIRFEVDGRSYVLQAGEAHWPSAFFGRQQADAYARRLR